MPRKPDERIEQAKEMYSEGLKLSEIAGRLKLPEGTVRRWKSTYHWQSERSGENNERSKKNSERSDTKKEKTKKAVAEAVDQVIENLDLTDKQRLFCVLYAQCFNATKAYQKAYGVDYSTAMAAGSRLLGNDKIKNEIQRLKRSRLNREMLDENDIFQKYVDIAFADITDFVSFGREQVPVMGPFGPITVKDKKTGKRVELRKEVNTVRFRESHEVDGTIVSEVKQGKDGASIKLADRMKALQWLSDHMNLTTEEQRARIAQIKAQTERLAYEHSGLEDDGVEVINDVKETGQDIRDNHTEISGDI